MDFEIVDSRRAKGVVSGLLNRTKNQDQGFRAFRFLQKKILSGQTQIQRNNFEIRHLVFRQNGEPVFFVNLYTSKNPSWAHFQAVGYPLILPQADLPAIKEVIVSLLDPARPAYMPLEAHVNLGISYAPQDDQNSFLTVPYNSLQAKFFELFEADRNKTYHALKLTDPTVLKSRIAVILKGLPEGFSFRPVSRFNFQRDMIIYSDLVRRCMSDHDLFFPVELEEELELLKGLKWIFDPRFFQFLVHGQKEIGFVFATPDFNQVLCPAKSDLKNAWNLLVRKSEIRKGRIIYKGILPEYRGQGLFRYLRHHVLNNFIEAGYQEIEGSYIDEDNQASLGDAQSTLFTKSHTFSIKTLRLS